MRKELLGDGMLSNKEGCWGMGKSCLGMGEDGEC